MNFCPISRNRDHIFWSVTTFFMFFRTPSGLSQHKVTHRPPDKVPWPCDQCERVCATKAQLGKISHKN